MNYKKRANEIVQEIDPEGIYKIPEIVRKGWILPVGMSQKPATLKFYIWRYIKLGKVKARRGILGTSKFYFIKGKDWIDFLKREFIVDDRSYEDAQ